MEQLEDRLLLNSGPLGQTPLAQPFVSGLYTALLGRPAQPTEVAGWQGAMQAGLSASLVADAGKG